MLRAAWVKRWSVFWMRVWAGFDRWTCRWKACQWRSIPLILLFGLGVLVPTLLSIPAAHSQLVTPAAPRTAAAADQPLQQGIRLYEMERYAEAIGLWQEAIDRFTRQSDPVAEALLLNNLSLAYQQLGQWDAATEAITRSLDRLRTMDPSTQSQAYTEVWAKALNTQGYLFWEQGNLEEALAVWQQATQSYSEAGYFPGVVMATINQAKGWQALGFSTQALQLLQSVERLVQQQPDQQLQATTWRYLGIAYGRAGELNRALEMLQAGIALTTDPVAKSAAYLELGNIERHLSERALAIGKLGEAQSYSQNALQSYQAAFQTTQAPMPQLQARLNQLSLLVATGQWTEAAALIPPIHQTLEQLSPSRTAVYARLNFAESLFCLKHSDHSPTCVHPLTADRQTARSEPLSLSWDTIARPLAVAIEQARQLQDPLAESYAIGQLGRLYEHTGQWLEAQTLTQQALMLAEALQVPDSAYRWEWQLGRLLQQQGDRPGAIAAYASAVQSLKQVRSDLLLINPEIQFSFRDQVEPVYRELVQLLLDAPDHQRPTQENLKQALQTIDALRLTELENFLGCNLTEIARLDEEVLDPNAATIYPMLLPDRLAIIFDLPGQPLEYQVIRLPRSDIETTVKALRRDLTEPGRTPEVIREATQIYQWLIAPLEPALLRHSHIKTLVFVLDGALRNIPMGVLYDGNQYFIEKGYGIAVAPRLNLFRPQPSDQFTILRGGVGIPQVIEGNSFPAIEQLGEELEQIPAELTRGAPLINEAFTKANIEQQLQTNEFSALHWKTHGIYSSDPSGTYLVAYQDSIRANDLLEIVQSARQRRAAPLELMVLSACETAEGDDRAILGLAGIAVQAGARSTVSTLWRASDDANTKLMARFYQVLTQPDTTKAEALRQAQLSLLKESGYPAPYYWATYVLVGNWL